MLNVLREKLVGVLGPTNTGKTHYAITRMIAHKNGIMGLPLRLLAREVYDKICLMRGSNKVALITGEEKILPRDAVYFVCTVEAMPTRKDFEFVAIDEIQLCADPDRGHIFTQRLLTSRGTRETLFLGSSTMENCLKSLFPNIELIRRPRLSELSYTGSKKISRLPARSAIIAFSSENVYSIAELVHRLSGGAAVVLGALSPRTRNAQVELFENGEVDYLVATDAVGMGLNLDIKHVAFSGIKKFDGRHFRQLLPNEIAQIAGRAGRNQINGSFGITGELTDLDAKIVDAIENHSFSTLKRLFWRNDKLDFSNVTELIESLEKTPNNNNLTKAREADDIIALKHLSRSGTIIEKLSTSNDVKLLWDVCLIPDYRKISLSDHCNLLTQIFEFLSSSCRISDDWLHSQILQINKMDGDIDTLSKRLSFIRTWSYVSNKKNWINDPCYWQKFTREIEDNLSDVLHNKLKQRFIDKRTSILIKSLRQREKLVADIKDDNSIFIDDQFIGNLKGFLFELDENILAEQKSTFISAASAALSEKLSLLAERFYRESDVEIDLSDQGEFIWQENIVGKIKKGSEILKPEITPVVSDFVSEAICQKIKKRLEHYLQRKIDSIFEPLLSMQTDNSIVGLSRGLSFRLLESLGIIPRSVVMKEVKQISQDERALMRKHGVRFGQFTIFIPALIKPAATKLRLILWGRYMGLELIPQVPPPGLVSVLIEGNEPKGYFPRAGLRAAGDRAIRIDMLERVADLIRKENSDVGFEASSDMLSLTGMSHEQFANLMSGLNYNVVKSFKTKNVNQNQNTAKAEDVVIQDHDNKEEAVVYTFKFEQRESKRSISKNIDETANIRKKKSSNRNKASVKNSLKGKVKNKNHGSAINIDMDNPFAALLALKEK